MEFLAWQKSIRKGEELYKLKDNVGTKTNVYKLAMNTFRIVIRRCLSAIKQVTFWTSEMERKQKS